MDFASSYKKKGIGLDINEKRILRVKRRSVNQRMHRDETFMKQRDLGSMTPLKENTNDNVQKNASQPTTRGKQGKAGKMLNKPDKSTAEIPKGVPAKAETTGAKARHEMLMKWKMEKELKKKLAKEKERQKPQFKVYKVNHEQAPSISSNAKSSAPNKSQIQKDTSLAQRRVTRASTKASASKLCAPGQLVTSQSKVTAPVPQPTKRVTRQSARQASKQEDQKENRRVIKPTTRPGPIAKLSNKPAARKQAVPAPVTSKPKLPSPSATQHVTSERGASFHDPTMQQSFAPSQFTFNFQFEPLSPASTQSFLLPHMEVRRGRCSTPTSACRRKRATSPLPLEISAIQSPKKPLQEAPSEMNNEGSKESKQETSPLPLEISAIQSPKKPLQEAPPEMSNEGSKESKQETSPLPLEISAIQSPKKPLQEAPPEMSNESSKEGKRATFPLPLQISAIQSPKKPLQEAPPEMSNESSKEDVSYFRNLLKTETSKLNNLCSKWEVVQNGNNLSEDVCGEIRCTIGKAQLLIDQRFKQFSGLVDNCEFGIGEKKTHCSDLTGFWDMIYFQVEDVVGMFTSLDKLQANNWVREVTKTAPIKTKKIIKKAKPATKGQFAKDREAARERLASIKASLKARQTRAKAAEQTVFEGGFFKVESPVRNPAPHCQAGSPFKTLPQPSSRSNANTPRVQGYTPKNARVSLQGKLCGPLSKLVLGEVATPTRKVATPTSKLATPIRKAETPIRKVDTPISKLDTPIRKLDTPVSKLDTPISKVDTPISNVSMVGGIKTTPNKKTATPCRTPAQNDEMPSVSNSTENENENPFSKYLQASMATVVNLNTQAEDFMQTQPEQQLVDLGVRSRPLHSDPAEPSSLGLGSEAVAVGDIAVFADSLEMESVVPTSNTPRTRSRSKSGILFPGLNSPHVRRTSAGVSKASVSSVFTPPPVTCGSASQIGDDLICFDSPASVNSAKVRRRSSANPKGEIDQMTCNVAKATMRRSMRLRHHSACSPLTSDGSTETNARLYKPNMSMI